MKEKDFVKEVNHYFLSDGRLSSGITTYIRNRKHLSNFIKTKYPDKSISEALYLIQKLPITLCEQCGGKTSFKSFGEGYKRFCSRNCASSHRTSALEKTMIRKYGVKRAAQLPTVRKKMKETSLKRHGVDNIFKDRERMQKGMMEKHGVSHPTQLQWVTPNHLWTKEAQERKAETNVQRYGNVCSIHGKEVWKKVKATKNQRYWNDIVLGKLRSVVSPLFSFGEYDKGLDENQQTKMYSWKCITCNKVFEDHIANAHVPRCPYCFPLTRGVLEKEVFEWMISEFPSERIQGNTRRVIKPYELDIYLPDRQLAIEFDELQWHTERHSNRGQNYHLNKTNMCKEKNIQLLHLWDIEWVEKQEIVKSMIRARLGIYERKLNARECTIREISSREASLFLEQNHIQGASRGSIRLALYSKEQELLSLILIGKNRFKKDTFEIVRFVSKINTAVRGGFSKLFKAANLKGEVLSYVDLRWFHGAVNSSAGFKLVRINKPSYHYTKSFKEIFNRIAFQKHNIQKKFPDQYNAELTEWQNMQLLGYDRIWDCGTTAWKIEIT